MAFGRRTLFVARPLENSLGICTATDVETMWEHHNPLLTCLYCAQKMRIPSNLCIRHLIAEGDNFLYPFIRHPSRDDAISFSNILI